MPKEQEMPPPATIVQLGKHWTAIVLHDGSVVMQHNSTVPICGTSEVFNLVEMQQSNHPVLHNLDNVDDERIAVRTLLLSHDGSVVCDPDGVSPKGELTVNSFTILPSTISSASRYFARFSGKNDW